MDGPTTQPLRVISCDANVAVAEHGPVCIALWRGPSTAAPFELQRAGLAEVVDNHPDGAGFLCVVEVTSKPPNETIRRASSRMVQSHRGRLRCVACVIEGSGFKAAANRGVLASIALLLDKGRFGETGVFATVGQAAVWMDRHMNLGPTSDLTGSVQRMREHIAVAADSGGALFFSPD